MAVTLAQALAAVRIRLDEGTATAWTNVEIRGWINEAVADIARRTETVQKIGTKAVVSGTQEYTSLPSDLLRLNRVEFISSGSDGQITQLEIRELNELDSAWYGSKQVTAGRPQYVGLSGYPPYLRLTLYPIPNETNATLKLYYYASPVRLATDGSADSTALEVPLGWEDLVYEYATYLAQRRDGNPAWQDAKRIYEEHLRDMVDMTRKWHDQAGYITPETDMDMEPWAYGGYGGLW